MHSAEFLGIYADPELKKEELEQLIVHLVVYRILVRLWSCSSCFFNNHFLVHLVLRVAFDI